MWLVAGGALWGIEADDGRAPRLNDRDAVATAGGSAASSAVLIFGRVHARPELTESRSLIKEDLADVTNKWAHIGDVDGVSGVVAIAWGIDAVGEGGSAHGAERAIAAGAGWLDLAITCGNVEGVGRGVPRGRLLVGAGDRGRTGSGSEGLRAATGEIGGV
jgi:hypothetical protein